MTRHQRSDARARLVSVALLLAAWAAAGKSRAEETVAPPAAVELPDAGLAEVAPVATRRVSRPRLELSAAIDPRERRVSGTATWTIANTGARPLDEVLFWLFPNRLASRPTALGDVNFHWLYPSGFSPASIKIGSVRDNDGRPLAPDRPEPSAAGADTLLRVRLRAALAPGDTVRLALDFTTELPERLGGFGCAGSQCRLMGGFYPFPVAQSQAGNGDGHGGNGHGNGFAPDAPPDRIDFQANVVAPAGNDVVLGDVFARSAGRPVASEGTDVAYVTLVTDRDLGADAITTDGFTARYLHRGRRPPPSEAEVLPYVREDRVGLVLEAARDGLAFLAAQGLGGAGASGPSGTPTPTPTPTPTLTLIQAPLRNELVTVHGQVVLVSDRLFEIFPLERVRKYHRLELVRAVIAAALDAPLRRVEPDPDVDLSKDVIAAYLADTFALGRFRRVEFARDLLRPLAFLPAVDQLIYAPLVASSSSYFGDADDRDLLRDDVRRFSHRRPGGRFVYAKLLDLLGGAGVAQVARMVVGERIPLRQAAARVFGAPLGWFWTQWLSGPPPQVNYRIASIQRTPLPPAGVHVAIDVDRQGADLVEPVEVRVVDRDEVAHDLVWKDRGARHRFELDLPAGLSSVEVDPRHRLTESAIGTLDPADDPLFDNRDPKRWRFIYSGFGALLDLSALQASFAAAVTLKPQHDLRNAFALLVSHTAAIEAGVSASYERRFGRQADTNRLTSGAGVGISVARPNPTFGVAAGAPTEPGWRLSGDLLFEDDDRDYFIDPWRAIGVEADVGYTLTALENGERFSQLFGGAEFLRLFELRPGHVLALDLQGGGTLGDLRKRSQLFHLGGATGLRGYGVSELLGRSRGVARVELRDRYVSDLDWNIAHFTSVRGFGGNFFVEAGAISSCDDFSFGKGDFFYDVGYSFRVLHDAFGVYQQLLSIDLAVPLNRHDRVCLGQHSLGSPQDGQMSIRRPPFVIQVSFLPNF